jgi:hypothetical protein
MTSIYGTEQAYEALVDFFPDFPKNNFTFNFNTVRVDDQYGDGYSFGWSDSFVSNTKLEEKQDTKNAINNNYLNNSFTEKNIKPLHRPDTIGNVINMLGNCKYFASLLNNDESFVNLLNQQNYIHGNTLFIPIDSSFHLLEEFYTKYVPDSTRQENKNIYTADLGVGVKVSGLLTILRTHILKQSIYPEQLIERPLRIKPLAEKNEFFMKNMKIYNIEKMNLYDMLSDPIKFDNVEPINILQAIECSNGYIYIIDRPLLPSVFFV